MKTIKELNSFDGTIKGDMYKMLNMTLLGVVSGTCMYILGYLVDLESFIYLSTAFISVLCILTFYEEYFMSLFYPLPPSSEKNKHSMKYAIGETGRSEIPTHSAHLQRKLPLYDRPCICFDITGVIKPICNVNYICKCIGIFENTSVTREMVNTLSKIVTLFGSNYVHLIGSGTREQEWVIKDWLEKNTIIQQTSIIRENIHFVRTDDIMNLSDIDNLKAAKCKKLKVTDYVDDRVSALKIMSNTVGHVTLFSKSAFELVAFENYKACSGERDLINCSTWSELYSSVFDRFDRQCDQKTCYPRKTALDDMLESYPFKFNGGPDGGEYLAIPGDLCDIDCSRQYSDIAFILFTNNPDSSWLYYGETPEAGYITNRGKVVFTHDDVVRQPVNSSTE